MKKLILVNILIFFFIIFSLEFIANIFKLSGLMGIQKGLIYNKDDINYFYPNTSGIIFNKKVFIDQFGFRVPSKNFNYNNQKNIFILGDSVAFGNGVQENETFVGLLRKKVKKNFLNTSVPGYQLNDQVEIIKKTKNIKNIEKILYFFTLNDVYGSSNLINAGKKKDESDFFLKKLNFLNEINAYLRNKSYLFMLIKGLGTDPSKRWFSNLSNEYKNNDLITLESNFEIIKDFSKKNKFELIVIILPYEYQTRKCSKSILMPQKKIQKILQKLEIQYKDLTYAFCGKERSKKYFYKFDPMHLSKNGHKLVYESLLNEINF